MRMKPVALLSVLMLAVLSSGCSTASSAGSGPTSGRSRVIHLVAAENFWGSIAAQLGGEQVQVTSVIDSPGADPHDFEPTAADARVVATADVVLVNGIGYDDWATKLVDANPSENRTLITVGKLLGVPAGGNPHRWYNPDDVERVVAELVRSYKGIDPTRAGYFDQRRTEFETHALSDYKATIADIKRTYGGTAVGASESIFAMVAPALGLKLLTPPGFLQAISNGADPSAADKEMTDEQINSGAIKVYVYNIQNATPDIQEQVTAARRHNIPVTTITETMTPATASWQQWQTAQLKALRSALAEAVR